MARKYTSMRGISVDLSKIMASQEKNITVGNTKSNARGDQLGRGGRVVKSAADIARDHYNKNPPNAVTKTTIKTDDVPVANDPVIEDDWIEPVTEKEIKVEETAQAEDEWVEDTEGNFVRKSELEEASDEPISKSKTNRTRK